MATNKVAQAAPRKRYTPSNDRAILEEVITINPFRDLSLWRDIAEKISCVIGRPFDTQSVKERVDLLLAQFLRNHARNRRKQAVALLHAFISWLPHQGLRTTRPLTPVADLTRECGYRPPWSAVRKHLCRGVPQVEESAASRQL
ncbi:hypothetical protein HPB50_011962 [Hyalomma asiaticum]|uniref:Uncharacterized protein n=1 Tax=Hyalomma asiaticum TaxID=266040 RepID=A0ACB7SQC7_HYAAI|nr:hypothetical protein HPB50_011962 [Hyalomma asiaticum]